MVLAAIRYQDSVRQASRADAAARAYYGMSGPCGGPCGICGVAGSCAALGAIGEDAVRIVDSATEAELAAALGTREELLDATSLSRRASTTNFGLNHMGEPDMPPRRTADRLMAWKKASGISPVDSTVTQAILNRLSDEGHFDRSALPTLDELRSLGAMDASTTGGTPEMPIEVLPPGTLPAEEPTETGLPAATPPVIQAYRRDLVASGARTTAPGGGVPATEGAPAAAAAESEVPSTGVPATSRAHPEGAPDGAVMIAPPHTAEVTVRGRADPVIVLLLILGLLAARRRR